MVRFDAHADLHLPATTTSGYLGGMALTQPPFTDRVITHHVDHISSARR